MMRHLLLLSTAVLVLLVSVNFGDAALPLANTTDETTFEPAAPPAVTAPISDGKATSDGSKSTSSGDVSSSAAVGGAVGGGIAGFAAVLVGVFIIVKCLKKPTAAQNAEGDELRAVSATAEPPAVNPLDVRSAQAEAVDLE